MCISSNMRQAAVMAQREWAELLGVSIRDIDSGRLYAVEYVGTATDYDAVKCTQHLLRECLSDVRPSVASVVELTPTADDGVLFSFRARE